MQSETNQFATAIKTLSQTVCQIIVDVKEKKKTPHIGLAELGVFINRFNDLKESNQNLDKAILDELLNLCSEAKACIEGDLN